MTASAGHTGALVASGEIAESVFDALANCSEKKAHIAGLSEAARTGSPGLPLSFGVTASAA